MISVVLPCRNEEKTIGICIDKIKEVFKKNKIKGEIIVSDSSSDNSPKIAKKLGVKVIKHNKVGYGNALLEGFKHAKGEIILIGDADNTYDFMEIPKFLNYLKEGYDFVIGNRFKGRIEKGAMRWSHRYIGNPLLSSTLRILFHTKIHDAHCGMRALTKKALNKLNLKTTGMEFASEMVINAINKKLRIKEIPINYHKRKGKSKLHSFSDGWRHLRFMFMYAPDYLFLIPGLIFFLLGVIIMAIFLIGPVEILGIVLYNRPMILGSFFTILGYQIITLGIYTKAYMKSIGIFKSDKLLDMIAKLITFESGIIIGTLLLLMALIIGSVVVVNWIAKGFPDLTSNIMLVVLTLGILGIQTMFSAFFLSILLLEKK